MECDRKKPAAKLLHSLGFKLKQLGIFTLAEKKAELYISLYSPEVMIKQITQGKGLVSFFWRLVFKTISWMIAQDEYVQVKIFKNKGNTKSWIIITIVLWLWTVGMFILWMMKGGILASSMLVFSGISLMFSGAIMENKWEDENDDAR